MVYNTKVYDYGKGMVQYRIHKKDIDDTVAKANGLRREGVSATRYEEVDGFQINTKTGEVRDESSIIRSLSNSAKRSKDCIWGIAQSNEWEWFLTLTFDPNKVNSFDYDECVKKVGKWFNNCRNNKAKNLKWLCVPEQHKSGRWHFHALISNIGSIEMVDSGLRDFGNIIYNVGSYNYGWTTATKVKDTRKASSYICKYVTKDLQDKLKNKRRYMASNNVNKPTVYNQMITNEDIYNLMLHDDLLYTKQVETPAGDDLITYITLLSR